MADRLFEEFLRAAESFAHGDLPLLISGGCGLNCEWNQRWRDTKLFSEVKEREDYRPIAPSCRSEELNDWFDPPVDDPYMLYFSKLRTDALPAITHVDGTARVHSVRKEIAPRLHQLLEGMRAKTGFGVLCNTSLNFKGHGFINRMSDLLHYCETKALADMVVNDAWYTRTIRNDERRMPI